MTKLQCNVSDSFTEVLDPAMQKAALEKHPEQKPPKLNNLIPTALLDYAETKLGITVDPKLREEAIEILTRKPGPRTKKPLDSHDLFDEKPGMWLSNVAIATGCALVACGEKTLHLSSCHIPSTAAEAAIKAGWGAIPEAKKTSNDPEHPGIPGMRFIPPGSDIAPKNVPAPAPMALADVGTWISEESIAKRSGLLVLSDGRVVDRGQAAAPSGSISVPCAVIPEMAPVGPDWTEAQKLAHKNAYEETHKRAILVSIAHVQVEAYELGWTMKREVRNGKPGILLIPPRVKLTYEIAPGRTVPVTQ
jgi:hypothetical protein